MDRKIIYLLLAALGLGAIVIVVVGSGNDEPKPLPPGVTATQAEKYKNAARRTEFNKSPPGKYEWTEPGK